MKKRIWACDELLKRYVFGGLHIPEDVVIDSLAVMISPNTSSLQKKAARVLLKYSIGSRETSDILTGEAIIKDRSDPLLYRWGKQVKERDNYTCVSCGSEKDLHSHHISRWADDIYNRGNVDNGVTLCKGCHALEHPEMAYLILGN